MLDDTQFKQDIEKWITEWVSVYDPKFGAIPCPFAKKAMLKNTIEYLLMEDKLELDMRLADIFAIPASKEVLVIGIDPRKITADELRISVEFHNKHFEKDGLVALEDHPDAVETINGVRMNHGGWALVLIQSSRKLHEASEQLKRAGYYDTWAEADLNDVLRWRPTE